MTMFETHFVMFFFVFITFAGALQLIQVSLEESVSISCVSGDP